MKSYIQLSLIYTSLFLLLLVLTLSCKKSFLDVENKNTISRQVYVTDLKSTGDFLNGVYVMLAQDFHMGYNTIYPELVADNVKPQRSVFTFHYRWNQQANDPRLGASPSDENISMNAQWTSGYKIIRACNFVLEKAEEYREQNHAKADLMKGQAYALRAFVHFELANVFAQSYNFTADASHPGIPYVTTSDWTQPVIRNRIAEVYDNIIADVNHALPLLNSGPSNILLMNTLAAKALLARVYLFKEDMMAAKSLAREVSTTVPIMTSNYPGNLFTPAETEALFQLPPEAMTYYTSFAALFFTTNYSFEFSATNDIAIILTERPNDVRRNWVTYESDNWMITKFPQNINPAYYYPEGSYYLTVFRSSEMYLTAAEAYARLNNEDSARFYLDAVRKRADPTADNTMAAGSALLDSIHKERRKEFAFEGHRMFDLLRWKKGVNRIDAPNPEAKNLPYPSNKAIAPIPAVDALLSGIPQNPSY